MAGKDDWKQTSGKAQRKKDADAYMNPPKNVSKAEDKKRFKTPKGSIASGNGPKRTHLDARSKKQLKARTK